MPAPDIDKAITTPRGSEPEHSAAEPVGPQIPLALGKPHTRGQSGVADRIRSDPTC